jgi:hypothetical protein
MPKKKKAPKTARKKAWLHAFYLMQPFMQFFALMAIILFLARCSPLSPSTDKGGAFQQQNAVSGTAGDNSAALAEEQAIQASLKEISQPDLTLIPEKSLDSTAVSLASNQSMDEQGVADAFDAKKLRKKGDASKTVLIQLSPSAHADLFRKGAVRVSLHQELKEQANASTRRVLFQNLGHALVDKELNATAHLVLPDAAMQQKKDFARIKLPVIISLGIVTDDKAYLEIRVRETPNDVDASLLEEALTEAKSLSILLE